MTRRLIPSPSFTRELKRLLKSRPVRERVDRTLGLLSADIRHPQLGTHKLGGKA